MNSRGALKGPQISYKMKLGQNHTCTQPTGRISTLTPMMTLVTGGADGDALKQEKPTTVKDSSGQAWPRPSQECAGGSSVDGTNIA